MIEYELDNQRSYDNGHHQIIAILTGHDIVDIIAASPDKDNWSASAYISTFRKLGFNCDDRFVKFDPETDKPCMMRHSYIDKRDNYWYACAYYNKRVYFGQGESWSFEGFVNAYCNDMRITSMLRVWI